MKLLDLHKGGRSPYLSLTNQEISGRAVNFGHRVDRVRFGAHHRRPHRYGTSCLKPLTCLTQFQPCWCLPLKLGVKLLSLATEKWAMWDKFIRPITLILSYIWVFLLRKLLYIWSGFFEGNICSHRGISRAALPWCPIICLITIYSLVLIHLIPHSIYLLLLTEVRYISASKGNYYRYYIIVDLLTIIDWAYYLL